LPNSRKIKDYKGINKDDWENEWMNFGKKYDYKISDKTILEIMLCMFSIAQFTEYKKDTTKGRMTLFQQDEGYLSLNTSEQSPGSKLVCFSIFGPYCFKHKYPTYMITDAVETRRVGDELRLYAGDLRII